MFQYRASYLDFKYGEKYVSMATVAMETAAILDFRLFWPKILEVH